MASFSPVNITNATWTGNGGTAYGLTGATMLEIKQNNKVMTDCNLHGNTEIACTSVGWQTVVGSS